MKLQDKFLELNCRKVVVPTYKSAIGNPVLLPRNYFKILKSLKEDFGAKSQIKKDDIVTVPTDIGTIFDIDTISSLDAAKGII
jgi:CTP:molybdopterin cytidylyltransferase MocA